MLGKTIFPKFLNKLIFIKIAIIISMYSKQKGFLMFKDHTFTLKTSFNIEKFHK